MIYLIDFYMIIAIIRDVMETLFTKKSAATLSIVSNSFIILLKLIVGLLSGSISIISEAIHSMSDFLASIITFFSVIKSAEPADSKHPFGHGKYEDMSGFIEGGLIIFAALYIIYEAVKKIFFGGNMEIDTTWGMVVMGIAVIVNILVSSVLFKVAKQTDSVSLFADAEHLRTDVISAFGVFAGLLLIKFTGIYILDPLIAIVVAVIIFKAGFSISKTTMDNLLDCSLPEADMAEICHFFDGFKNNGIVDYKNLKARRLGPHKNVEVTFLFPKDMTIYDCHAVCDQVEHKLAERFGDISASIHLEPETCDICSEKVN